MTFGESLVFYRTKKGLSQKELAARLNITPTRLNYWEKDKRQPDVPMIKALSSELETSADVLIGLKADNEEKSPKPVSTEDMRTINQIATELKALLVNAGYITADADITDEQLRVLGSVVIMLRTYFNEGR